MLGFVFVMNMIEIRTCRSQESRWARILKMMWRQPRSARRATRSTILYTPVVIAESIWTDHFCPSSLFTRQRCCHCSNWLKVTKARHFCIVQPSQILTQNVSYSVIIAFLRSSSSWHCFWVAVRKNAMFWRTRSAPLTPHQAHSRLTRQNVKSPPRPSTSLHLKIRSTWAQDIVESGVIDCPTQLIWTWIFICSMTKLKEHRREICWEWHQVKNILYQPPHFTHVSPLQKSIWHFI